VTQEKKKKECKTRDFNNFLIKYKMGYNNLHE